MNIAKADSMQGKLGAILAASYTLNQMTIKPYIKPAITCEFTKINTVAINSINLNNGFTGNG